MSSGIMDPSNFVDERFVGELPHEEYIEEALTSESLSQTLIADVMREGALIVMRGWIQGRPFMIKGGKRYTCANGALWLATGLSFDDGEPKFPRRFDTVRQELWSAAVDALGEYVGQPSYLWNDANGQTVEEVALTMLELSKELHETATSGS